MAFNAAMHKALWLAVEGGMRFEKDDFLTLSERFKMGRWATSSMGYGEDYYALAVAVRNISACRAIEAWKNRKPFIVQARTPSPCGVARVWSGRGRLAVGSKFMWQAWRVTVTSFNDAADSLTAVYREDDPHKLTKRFRIGRKQLLALAPATKLRQPREEAFWEPT